MTKPLINNKIIYNNFYGRVSAHDVYLNQGVRTYDSPTFNNIVLTGDALIAGNLYVEGNTSIFNNNIIEFEDNILLINRQETSNGVSLNQAGIEVERGNLENYRIVFQESDDTFRVGVASNLTPVVIREELPLTDGIMTWDNVGNRIKSTNEIKLETVTFLSTKNSINNSSGSIVINGGVGISKDISLNGKLITSNNGTNISSRTNNNLIIEVNTQGNLEINTMTTLLQYESKLAFGITSNSIVTNTSTNNININGLGNILFNIPNTKNITIPNSVPIIFSTVNEKISSDSNSNMNIQSSQDINLIVPSNKRIFIDTSVPIVFGNNNQKINSDLTNDLLINAGNNILLTPGPNLNVLIPINNGIKFGNTGNQRIFMDNNNDLNIQSLTNLNLNVSVGSIIKINDNVPLYLGTSFIKSNSINLDISSNIVNLLSTINSTNISSGALVVNGGVGIMKDVTIGGSVRINGNLSILGTSTIIDTETLSLRDNIIVMNNGIPTIAGVDGGLLVKRFSDGNSNTEGNIFAGVIYKENVDEFAFIYTTDTSPNLTVTVSQYLPIRAKGIVLTNTENAIGIGTGGGLIIKGGGSIEKTLYVDILEAREVLASNLSSNNFDASNMTVGNLTITGLLLLTNTNASTNLRIEGNTLINGMITHNNIYINTNTTTSINSSTGSLIYYGGLSINNTENAISYTNGGSLTIKGGVSINKDTYINNNLYVKNGITVNNISSNNIENNVDIINGGSITINKTTGNTLIVKGDVDLFKNVLIRDSINVNKNIKYHENSHFQSISNPGIDNKWILLGMLNNGYINISMYNESEEIECYINKNNTLIDFYFNKKYTTNNTISDFFIYKDISDNFFLYSYIKHTATTYFNINSNINNNLQFIDELNNTLPLSHSMSWILTNTTKNNQSNVNFDIGALIVNNTLKINDRIPEIGYNSITTSNLGIKYQRFQTNNDIGDGDIINNDIPELIDTLPNQIGLNLNQIKLSNSASNINDYYIGYFVRFGNYIRKIVTYSGGTRVLEFDINLIISPVENDIVSLYSNNYILHYFNETTKRLEFGLGPLNTIKNKMSIDIDNIYSNKGFFQNTSNNISYTSENSLNVNGGLSVYKDIYLGGKLNIGNVINNTSGGNIRIQNTENFVIFNTTGGNNKILLENSISNYSLEQKEGLFYINNNIILNTNGSIGIGTSNLNNDTNITLKNNSIIGIDNTSGTLQIIGNKNILNSSSIIFSSGNLDIDSGSIDSVIKLNNIQNIYKNNIIYTNTQSSTNSSSGSLIYYGGLSINNTANSSGYTNGGALTINGGVSINKDTYINGTLFCNTILNEDNIKTSVITTSNAINCNIINLDNIRLLTFKNSTYTEYLLTFNISILPSLESEITGFEFILPYKINNLVNRLDSISNVSGYTDDTNLIVLQNIISVGITGTLRNIVKFQSSSNTIHYLQITCRYSE
jgi:hypothetical protein